MLFSLDRMKNINILTRILGTLLIALAIYMWIEDKEYATSFDKYDISGMRDHKDISINYLKVLIIGLISFFYREIRMYLDYVKYS